MEKEFKLIENKTNTIISKAPAWIFRWGLISTILSICLLIIISFIVPYKESFSCVTEFHTKYKIVPVLSPAAGILGKEIFNMQKQINPNQYLCTIQEQTEKRDFPVYSMTSGIYENYKTNLKYGTYVNKGDTLFFITPVVKSNEDLYCIGMANLFDISKITPGDKVMVSIEQYGRNLNIRGFISSISRVPDQSGKYPFYIKIQDEDLQYLMKNHLFSFKQAGKAQVIYKSQKLVYKLMGLVY